MKTEEFIHLLAADADAVPVHADYRRFAITLMSGTAGAFLLMLLFLGIRPDLMTAAAQPLFWVKVGFVVSLLAASLFAVLRLARPGAVVTTLPVALALPVLVMWLIAGTMLGNAEPDQRLALFLGATWATCPFLIALLSIPAFIGAFWAMRGLAPTRPRAAGFGAGLLAGSVAALVYCLHCPEMQPPFIGYWYLAGMLIPAAFGCILGGKILRW